MNNFKRDIDYLRISVTDRCNLRCIYCMPPEGVETIPQQELLTFEEIIGLAKIFANLGVRKIRLTGGEPLIRKGIVGLIGSLVNIEGIEEVSLTTNGILLSMYARELKKAGINRINISLDSLKEDKFGKITGSNCFCRVLEGIEKAKEAGFSPLKLNMVVMKGINDEEIVDFLEFALSQGLILRFIEFMKVTPLWKEDYFLPIEAVRKICERSFILSKMENRDSGPAQYYRLRDGIVGFIKTDENNCRRCTRLRLTSTGELKVCLYESDGVVLKDFLRRGVSEGEIRDIIKIRIEGKRYTDYRSWRFSGAYMCSVGG